MDSSSTFGIGFLLGLVMALFLVGFMARDVSRDRGVRAGIAHYSTTTGDFHWDSTTVRGDTVFVTRSGK